MSERHPAAGEERFGDAGRRAVDAGMDPGEWRLRVALACLFRINAHLGWEDSINTHSTVRLPGEEERFLINPFGVRFDEVRASDLIVVDVDGRVIGESPHPVNEAGYVIHSAIHTGRADARCVIHTHTVPGMAVAAMEDGLAPISMFALGFHEALSYHEFEGAAGEHNLSERERLAASLGPVNNAMILRNHGLLTVGRTVAEAFVWMYRLNKACEVQVLTHGAAGGTRVPGREAAEHTVTGTRAYVNGFGAGGPGEVEFAAFARKMDRIDPSYRE